MDEDLSYITSFLAWLEDWKERKTPGLSIPTFKAAIRTCKAVIFDRYENLEYILLGNISSDFLEGRFGWWRQMCGGNYYNSVAQFLQAEKTIRLRSLISMGYDIQQIKKVFQLSNNERSLQQKEEIKCFLTELENFKVTDDSALRDGEKSLQGILQNVWLKKNVNPATIYSLQVTFLCPYLEHEEDSSDDPAVGAKTEFLNTVSRGGLRKPSDCIYISCVHASTLNRYIFASEELKSRYCPQKIHEKNLSTASWQ